VELSVNDVGTLLLNFNVVMSICCEKRSSVINSIYSGLNSIVYVFYKKIYSNKFNLFWTRTLFLYGGVNQWSHDPSLTTSYIGEKETILIIKFSLKPLTP